MRIHYFIHRLIALGLVPLLLTNAWSAPKPQSRVSPIASPFTLARLNTEAFTLELLWNQHVSKPSLPFMHRVRASLPRTDSLEISSLKPILQFTALAIIVGWTVALAVMTQSIDPATIASLGDGLRIENSPLLDWAVVPVFETGWVMQRLTEIYPLKINRRHKLTPDSLLDRRHQLHLQYNFVIEALGGPTRAISRLEFESQFYSALTYVMARYRLERKSLGKHWNEIPDVVSSQIADQYGLPTITLQRALAIVHARWGRGSDEALANHLRLTMSQQFPDDLDTLQRMMALAFPQSIDDWEALPSDASLTLRETRPEHSEAVKRSLVLEQLELLPDRMKQILKWSFGVEGEELTVKQIAVRLGVTYQAVSMQKIKAEFELRRGIFQQMNLRRLRAIKQTDSSTSSKPLPPSPRHATRPSSPDNPSDRVEDHFTGWALKLIQERMHLKTLDQLQMISLHTLELEGRSAKKAIQSIVRLLHYRNLSLSRKSPISLYTWFDPYRFQEPSVIGLSPAAVQKIREILVDQEIEMLDHFHAWLQEPIWAPRSEVEAPSNNVLAEIRSWTAQQYAALSDVSEKPTDQWMDSISPNNESAALQLFNAMDAIDCLTSDLPLPLVLLRKNGMRFSSFQELARALCQEDGSDIIRTLVALTQQGLLQATSEGEREQLLDRLSFGTFDQMRRWITDSGVASFSATRVGSEIAKMFSRKNNAFQLDDLLDVWGLGGAQHPRRLKALISILKAEIQQPNNRTTPAPMAASA